MTIKLLYPLFTLFVLLDALTTYHHLTTGQMIVRPSIVILLLFYYFQKRGFSLEIRDYVLISYYFFVIIGDLVYIHLRISNIFGLLTILIIKYGLLIYVLLTEATFHIKNQRKFIILSIFWVTMGFGISYIGVSFEPNHLLDEIIAAQLGFLAVIVLSRNTNKRSYEQLVLGIMFSILAVVLSAGNTHLPYIGVDILGRTTFSIGNLFITLGILRGMVYEKG